MKRFRHGPPFGISTQCLPYTQTEYFPREIHALYSVDATACSLGLCLRFQDMMLVHRQRLGLLFARPGVRNGKQPPLVWYICKHTSAQKLASDINLLVEAYRKVQDAPEPASLRTTLICDRCRTEALVEVYRAGAVAVLTLTRWINLGLGLSPDDPRWTIHCKAREYDQVTLDLSGFKVSPRACFELALPRSLEDVQAFNLHYLKNEQYKRSGREVSLLSRRVWYVLPKTPPESEDGVNEGFVVGLLAIILFFIWLL